MIKANADIEIDAVQIQRPHISILKGVAYETMK